MTTDAQLEADVFDLEMDLLEFFTLTVPGFADGLRSDKEKLVYHLIAGWAYSRGAEAPLKRG